MGRAHLVYGRGVLPVLEGSMCRIFSEYFVSLLRFRFREEYRVQYLTLEER